MKRILLLFTCIFLSICVGCGEITPNSENIVAPTVEVVATETPMETQIPELSRPKAIYGIALSDEIQEIDLSDTDIDNLDEVEETVALYPNLEKVIMCRCGIDNETMEELNLRHPEVEYVWMVQVCQYGIRTDTTYFCQWNADYNYPRSNNSFQELYYCHDMIAMDLGHLGNIENTAFLTGMPHLQYLCISEANVQQMPELAELQELVWLELFLSDIRDISPLLECKNLRHLNICYIRVPDMKAYRAIIEQMTWLERLWISESVFDSITAEQMRQNMPNTQIVTTSGGSTDDGWRDDQAYFEMRDALHMYYMDAEGNTVLINPYTGEGTPYPETIIRHFE